MVTSTIMVRLLDWRLFHRNEMNKQFRNQILRSIMIYHTESPNSFQILESGRTDHVMNKEQFQANYLNLWHVSFEILIHFSGFLTDKSFSNRNQRRLLKSFENNAAFIEKGNKEIHKNQINLLLF